MIGEHVINLITCLTGLRPELKQPNDVLMNGRKLAGVLCQSAIEGEQVRYVLIGIGLNANIASEDLPVETATSLLVETGREWDLDLLLNGVLDELERCWCFAPPLNA